MTVLAHWISPLVTVMAGMVFCVMLIDRRAKAKDAEALALGREIELAWMKSHTLVGRYPRVFLAALTLFVVMLFIGPRHWPLY